jgi:hypothetical protein
MYLLEPEDSAYYLNFLLEPEEPLEVPEEPLDPLMFLTRT